MTIGWNGTCGHVHDGNVAYHIFVALWDSLNSFVAANFSYIWINYGPFWHMSRVMLGYYVHFVIVGFIYVFTGFVVFRHTSSVILCYDIHESPYCIAKILQGYVALWLR